MEDDDLIVCPSCGKMETLMGHDVIGADDGNVFCTDCHHEFDPSDAIIIPAPAIVALPPKRKDAP